MDEVQSIVIRRSVRDVYAFLEDFENDPQWRAELLGIHRLPDMPDEVTARYEQEVHWEGRTMQADFEVTSVVLDRRIEFSGQTAGVIASASYAFEELSEGETRLTVRGHFETTGPLHVLEPFMHGLIARQVRTDLDRLRQLMEDGDERQTNALPGDE